VILLAFRCVQSSARTAWSLPASGLRAVCWHTCTPFCLSDTIWIMKVVVTGGAGYIGSHVVRRLVGRGDKVVVIDLLESSSEKSLPEGVELVKGDVGDRGVWERVLGGSDVNAILHFAGYIQAGESVLEPGKYLTNNLVKPVVMLEAMVKSGVNKLIFSSSAGIYGNPEKLPIWEDHSKRPTNPYGVTKWLFEEVLGYYDRKYGIKSVSLRYFNAAGAEVGGKYGEAHIPESHIIPLAIEAAKSGGEFKLFGTDYPTADGTCVRDYIHIEDLGEVHLLALEKLLGGAQTDAINVGSGKGWTNRQVLEMVERVVGKKINIREGPQRAGDAHTLVAGVEKMKKEWGWEPKHSDLAEIVRSAWEWHSGHPEGY